MKIVIYLCLFMFLSDADDKIVNSDDLEGPNVCKRVVTENITVIVTEMVPYQETKIEWCASVPPRCRKTVIKLKAVNKTEVLEKTRTIQECCNEYEIKQGTNLCILKRANQDEVPLNKLCNAGWTGEFCHEPCSDGLWGVNCKNICKCQNKSKCRKYDGRCLCEFGFTGDFCEQKCPNPFYGNDCTETCNCPNVSNFQCHHVYGCRCTDGFRGLSCEELDEQK
ncbi:unnamed protein product [Chironomus riparius]|uniref:EMI domain-containing protein n=1 Tax=Chironomus riparius TaxID=315576 RepID=A0A9N9WPN5_9DIPT|nr:unnamed protein product [Chironomus riparius]